MYRTSEIPECLSTDLGKHCSVRRHLMAQTTAMCVIISTAAIPAAALAPSSPESTAGVISVIRRVFERSKWTTVEQPPTRTSSQMSPQEQADFYQRVLNRREERQRILDVVEKQEPGIPRAQSLEGMPTNRQRSSTQQQEEKLPTSREEFLNNVGQRRKLREAEQKQARREEEEQKEKIDVQKGLREQRAEIAAKRRQYDTLRMAMLDAINRERMAENLPPLTSNKNLELAAQLHAEDMFTREYFDHFSPEGLSYIDRIQNIGYTDVEEETCNCTAFKAMLGENLAKGQRSVNWAINELMESPSHRQNILSGYFKEVGIGISENIWVQNFGAIEYTTR